MTIISYTIILRNPAGETKNIIINELELEKKVCK